MFSAWGSRYCLLYTSYVPTGQKIYFRGLDDPLKVTSITVEIAKAIINCMNASRLIHSIPDIVLFKFFSSPFFSVMF